MTERYYRTMGNDVYLRLVETYVPSDDDDTIKTMTQLKEEGYLSLDSEGNVPPIYYPKSFLEKS